MNCSCSSYETVKKACIASLLIQFDMAGMDTIQERRGQKTEKPALLNGPGKVSSILSSTFTLNIHLTGRRLNKLVELS
jgi:3-methyladenine DNA glycosylase Mpg